MEADTEKVAFQGALPALTRATKNSKGRAHTLSKLTQYIQTPQTKRQAGWINPDELEQFLSAATAHVVSKEELEYVETLQRALRAA